MHMHMLEKVRNALTTVGHAAQSIEKPFGIIGPSKTNPDHFIQEKKNMKKKKKKMKKKKKKMKKKSIPLKYSNLMD